LPHFIGNITDPVFHSSFNNNSDARQPDDLGAWPLALILDFFYGCAAYENVEAKFGELNEGSEEGDISQQAMDRHAQYKERNVAKENGNGSAMIKKNMDRMSLVK